jgi:tetratricopeptide (TPR) repeat protein
MKTSFLFAPVRNLSLVCLVAFGLNACQQATQQAAINFATLDESKLYEVHEVKDFIFATEEVNTEALKEKAKKDFLKAIDLRENQKKAQEAVQYFKQAASILPDANTYYELANTLLEVKQYEEAEKALTLAEELYFTPLAKLYYKKAQIAAHLEYGEYSVKDYLSKALEQGFADKTMIENDNAFEKIKNTEVFQLFFVEKFSKETDKAGAEFKLFLRGFPEKLDNFEISPDNVAKLPDDKYISYEFANYVNEMETRQDFGREVGSEYFYVAKVKETPQYAAVLYAAKDAIAEELPPVFTYLVTYNWQGKEISKVNFACQCTPKDIKTGKIDNNLVTITSHKRQWQAEFTELPPAENKIKSVAEIEKKQYEITENGVIKEISKNLSTIKLQKSWF